MGPLPLHWQSVLGPRCDQPWHRSFAQLAPHRRGSEGSWVLARGEGPDGGETTVSASLATADSSSCAASGLATLTAPSEAAEFWASIADGASRKESIVQERSIRTGRAFQSCKYGQGLPACLGLGAGGRHASLILKAQPLFDSRREQRIATEIPRRVHCSRTKPSRLAACLPVGRWWTFCGG